MDFLLFLSVSSPWKIGSFNRLLSDIQVEFFAPLAWVLHIPLLPASVSGAICASCCHTFSNSSPQNIPRGRQSSLHFDTDIRGLAGEISNWPKILELTRGAGNTVSGSSGGGTSLTSDGFL